MSNPLAIFLGFLHFFLQFWDRAMCLERWLWLRGRDLTDIGLLIKEVLSEQSERGWMIFSELPLKRIKQSLFCFMRSLKEYSGFFFYWVLFIGNNFTLDVDRGGLRSSLGGFLGKSLYVNGVGYLLYLHMIVWGLTLKVT